MMELQHDEQTPLGQNAQAQEYGQNDPQRYQQRGQNEMQS